MATTKCESVDLSVLIAARTAAATKYAAQAETVASLRVGACDAADLDAALALLKECRQNLDAAKKAVDAVEGDSGAASFDRAQTETLLKRRFFIAPAFEIYDGVAGLYDYGPPGKFLTLLCVALMITPSSLRGGC